MVNQRESNIDLDSVMQHFEKANVFRELVKRHEISNVQSIETVERYNKDRNRGGMIITCKDESNGQSEKVLLDFKFGQPCIDQVYDAIYTNGKDCSKRIIMFGGTGAGEEISPATDEFAVGSLITSMNHYPLNLYFVRLDCSSFETTVDDLTFSDEVSGHFAISQLPSEERFREVEFWNVYFESLYECFYKSWAPFEDGIDNESKYGWTISDDSLDVKVEWTKQGAFYWVVQTDDEGDRLKEIWDAKEHQLRRLFPDAEIQFIYLPGKLPKIAIKFWEIPVSYLVDASNAERMRFAKSLYSALNELDGFVEI